MRSRHCFRVITQREVARTLPSAWSDSTRISRTGVPSLCCARMRDRRALHLSMATANFQRWSSQAEPVRSGLSTSIAVSSSLGNDHQMR